MATLKLRRGSSFTSPQISEPFFNTINKTMLVGYGTAIGEQITLVKLGANTGSIQITGDLTASNITLTGDLSARNVNLSGNIIIGDEIADNIIVQAAFSGSLIPSASNAYDVGTTTKKWKNLFVVSASIDDVTLPGSNILSSSQQISDYTKFLEIQGDNVVSGSIQVDHDATTNFVSNEHINHTQVSIFAGSGMSGGGNIAGNRTITLSTGSAHFLEGVKKKINTEDVVSGSIQVDHDATTNFVSNEHIDHTSVSITAGEGLTGGGTIASTRTINIVTANDGIDINSNNIQLVNTSSTFTNGVKAKLNTETVISGSVQVNADNVTNFDTNVKDKLNVEDVISGSSQVILNDADYTGFDTNDISEGSTNLYYTDTRVKTKLNAETVISGSTQVNANTITNFDTNVKDKLNVEDVISGSTQIDITHLDTDDLSEGSTNLYYTDTRVKTKLNTEGVISGSSQVNANTITNFDSNVQTKIDDVGLFSGSSQVNANTITNFDANVRDYIRDIDVISGSSQVTESLDSRYLEIVGDNVFTGSSQVVLNDADKTGFDTADVVEGTNLYYTDVRVKTKLNTETVISGSSQVILNDADYTGFDTNDISEGSSNLYYTDTRVKNKLNDETVVSGSAQININHLDTDNLSEGSSNIYYTDVRVKTKLNTETVISGSSQVDIHSTDGYVANEHIDHSTISVGSGKGLTGGGTIDTNRSLTLNTGSAHFGEGVINALTGSGIISSSLFTSPSQGTSRLVNNGITTSVDLGLQTGDSPTFDGLTITSPTALGNTNFTVLMSGASGAVGKRTLATGAFYHVSSSISDGNTAVLGNAGAVKTYIDEALIEVGAGDITRVTAGAGMSGSTDSGEATVAIDTGSNHFGLGVINALTGSGIVSSSAQVNANTITNFDTNVRDYIRSLDVVSGSSQVSLGGDVTGFANDVNVGSVQGVALTSAEVTQLATIGDSTTISATQWGYLGGSNQNVKTNSDVTFASASLSNVTISGNLTVLGDATEIATSELRISDKLITVASGSTTPSQADGAGIEIAGANESITWDNGNSRFNFSDDVYASGTIKASSDIVAFASSDKELKNNITPIKNPIDKINKISGNSFDWNEDKQNIYKGKDYGVIAQEIEKVLPELVVTRESGYKAVKYEKLVSLLIEGIKELSSEVNQLKEKINKEL